MTVQGEHQTSILAMVLGTAFCAIAIIGIISKTAPAQNLATGTLPSQPRTAVAVGASSQPNVMSQSARVLVGSLALQSTVRVSAKTCDGYLVGTGFLVGDHVITNRHLVAGATQAKVDIDDVIVFAEVLSPDDPIDLAVLDGWQLLEPSLPLANQNPEIDAPILLAGHARGGPIQLRSSFVHGFVDGDAYGISGTIMLIDSPTEPGFSGGPVLNETGEVVAVLQGFDLVTELTLAVPVESMSAWLENVGLTSVNASTPLSEHSNSAICP